MDLSPNSSHSPCASPDSEKQTIQSNSSRQNQVGSVLLEGVPIVSLIIDGSDRLCLAQISNTLLKHFSYNEIHNRRVALGITCVQCTPVQLEILRRAGAMPISSRRCGMITKREAERLVKSFLEDNLPPKLPDNFAFDVYHKCGWGSQGKFMPSRYNSSRAKCIKCNFCNLYYSPNKFIFHCHRTPVATYNHPDAANFNSWRRHLLLCNEDQSENLEHAWEDVKAMFNGGSRKRILSQSKGTSRDDYSPSEKRPSLEMDLNVPSLGCPTHPYPMLPVASTARNFTGIFPRQSAHPAFHMIPTLPTEQMSPTTPASMMMDVLKGKYPSMFPTYGNFWGAGFPFPGSLPTEKNSTSKMDVEQLYKGKALYYNLKKATQTVPDEVLNKGNKSKKMTDGSIETDAPYFSAFRPVGGRDGAVDVSTIQNKTRVDDSREEENAFSQNNDESDINVTSDEEFDDDDEDDDDDDVENLDISGKETMTSCSINTDKHSEPNKNLIEKNQDKIQADHIQKELSRLMEVRKQMEEQYLKIQASLSVEQYKGNSARSREQENNKQKIETQLEEAQSVMLDFTKKMKEIRKTVDILKE